LEQQLPPLTQVLVTNISPTANEQTLASFFSFCGTITNLKLTTHGSDSSEAIVSFESEAAAKTALLLTNAVIADRPITVMPYGAQQPAADIPAPNTTEISGDQIPNKPHAVPADQRTQTSVIAGLVAAGYTLGEDAIAKARKIDEEQQITTKVAVAVGAAATATKEKIAQIDQAYHISEKVGSFAEGVSHKAREVDQSYHISENISSLVKNVTDTVEVMQARAKEMPVVQNTISTLSHVAENVSNFISPGVQAISEQAALIREQSNQMIEERHRARSSSADPIPNPDANPNPNPAQPPPPPEPQHHQESEQAPLNPQPSQQ